jgi:DNA-binding XRE family transcriptional regulator
VSRTVSITWEVMVVALTVGYTAGRKEGHPMSPPASVSTAHPFGALLRQWRTARKMSQFALALEADISARHLSFLETGRTQPSRDMVLLLATSLDVPALLRCRCIDFSIPEKFGGRDM